MRVKSWEVEGYGPHGAFVWKPGPLTLVAGDAAATLGRAVGHLVEAARGWSTLSESLDGAKDDLAASPRESDGAGETRWWVCLAAPEDDPTRRDFTAELVVGRWDGGWEVAFERVCRCDDFVEEELVGRQGMRATYHQPFVLRSMHDRPKREAHSVASDMSVLGALRPLMNDTRAMTFLDGLARFARYRPAAMTARVDARFGGYSTRLSEDGDNLVNVLAELDVHPPLRDRLAAVLAATVPGYTGYAVDLNARAENTFVVHTDGGEALAPSALPEAAWQSLVQLAALGSPSPPAWLWVERAGEGVPEAVLSVLAEALHETAARAQVTLWEPAPALRGKLLAEGAEGAERPVRAVEADLTADPGGRLVLTPRRP